MARDGRQPQAQPRFPELISSSEASPMLGSPIWSARTAGRRAEALSPAKIERRLSALRVQPGVAGGSTVELAGEGGIGQVQRRLKQVLASSRGFTRR